MFLQKYFRVFHLQTILSFIGYGFASILYLHFYKNHISLGELFLAEGLAALVMVALIALRKSCFSRRDMQIGFVLVALSFFLLFLPFSKAVFFIYTIVRIVGTIIFYIPYNYVHFQGVKKNVNLVSMTWYWAIPILCSIVGPLMGAWIFSMFQMLGFLLFALAFIALGMYLTHFIPEEKISYTRQDILQHLKGYRTINILDGALHKATPMLTLFALLYIETEFEFGGFLSLVGGVSILGALYMAKLSDKKKQRMIFLIPLSILAGLTTFVLSFVHTFLFFCIVTLVLRILTVFVEPVRANIILDTQTPSPLNWIVREFYLNLGRALFLIVAYIVLTWNLPVTLFIFSGLLHFIFPFVVYLKKVYPLANPKLEV